MLMITLLSSPDYAATSRQCTVGFVDGVALCIARFNLDGFDISLDWQWTNLHHRKRSARAGILFELTHSIDRSRVGEGVSVALIPARVEAKGKRLPE